MMNSISQYLENLWNYILFECILLYLCTGILAAILIIIGFQLWILGLVADLMSVNRKLLEDIQLKLRKNEIEKFNSN